MTEPERTGTREAAGALSVEPKSKKDRLVRDERLSFADSKLAEAITLIDGNSAPGKLAYLHFVRGMIAEERGAGQFACQEYSAVIATLKPLLKSLPELEERYLYVREHSPKEIFWKFDNPSDPLMVRFAMAANADHTKARMLKDLRKELATLHPLNEMLMRAAAFRDAACR